MAAYFSSPWLHLHPPHTDVSMPPTLLLLLLLLSRRSCAATDRLQLGESISTNETLSSSTSAFVLGFFCPSDSTSRCYLGIWRNGSPVRTAIWVANRVSPVPLSSAIFRLSNDSNLEVADSNGTIHWSTGMTPSPRSSNSTVVLLDSGHLSVRTAGNMILWQSLDHATDTVIPGTAIWANYKTHTAATATSWRSPDDPAPGEFSLSVDPYTPMQGIAFRGKEKWWRSNVWKGVSYSGLDLQNEPSTPFISFSSSPEWWNFSFAQSEISSIMAVRLEYNGSANLRLWIQGSNTWRKIYSFTDGLCNIYGPCGPFAYCSAVKPKCQCLDGFDPGNKTEWDMGVYKTGCVRRQPLACDGKDGFRTYNDMKMPDYNIYLPEIGNRSACEDLCRRNCSCVAYAYADLRTTLGIQPRCLLWVGDLVDLVFNNDTSGEPLYVRIQNADSGSSKKDSKLVIVLVPLVCGVVILFAILACLMWRRKTKRGRPSKNEKQRPPIFTDSGESSSLSGLNGDANLNGYLDLPLLDYRILVSATDNFSELNKIGQGGFGNVYKGLLEGGQEVAIKKLSKESYQGLAEFINEVALIAQLQHRNLVKLLNCCVHGDERLLIYEYMPNRSLELLLFDTENEKVLDWGRRFNIIKGIARGLLYLHEESRLKVIHRDLKASNILLDGDMNPKISDFGMARIFGGDQNEANTRRIVGTYGYISPEYAMEGMFSVKSDVYSFGVLLLEIITGRKNTSFRSGGTFPSLLSYAWESWHMENQSEVVALPIRDSCSMAEVVKCMHIGLLCVQDDLDKRPTMSSVVFLLENEAPIQTKPEKPTFTGWTFQDEGSGQVQYPEAFSANHVSITVLQGR